MSACDFEHNVEYIRLSPSALLALEVWARFIHSPGKPFDTMVIFDRYEGSAVRFDGDDVRALCQSIEEAPPLALDSGLSERTKGKHLRESLDSSRVYHHHHKQSIEAEDSFPALVSWTPQSEEE